MTRSRRLAATLSILLVTGGCMGPAENTVTIKRDSYGVPHVFAEDVYRLFYGYGFVVAEDRLFQMEMAKRSVMGTVSEVLGPDYVDIDTRSRTVSDFELVADQLSDLPPEDLDIFEGYAAGYSARVREVLADRDRLMPKQFVDFDFEPSEWTALDVAMIWVGTMANRFSTGSSEVFSLARLNQLQEHFGEELGRDVFDQIQWLEDPLAPTTVPREASSASPRRGSAVRPATPSTGSLARLAPVSASVLAADDALDAAWRGVAHPDELPVASNLWILGPEKTEDGSTILNNGPQFGWFNPSYTYGIGLHGAGFDVVGQTPFAYPVILFGTNGQTTWGSTAGPLDVNDYYQVQLEPENQHVYFFDGEYRPMDRRTETIAVRDAEPVTLEIYSTVHGTVTTFDVDNGVAYALKRSWEGQEVESLLGWLYEVQAQSWEEFLEQAGRIAITINHYYADADGNIGYVSPGRLPLRPEGQDQRLPAIGDGSMEWLGFRPFEQNPRVLNPPQGYVINWNNQSAAHEGGHGNWSVVDRVTEFTARLEAQERFTREEVWDLNRVLSFADPNARYFMSYILDAAEQLPAGDPARIAVDLLSSWDMLNTDPDATGSYTEPAATIMRTWLPLMYERVLFDDLPAGVLSSSAGYPGRRSRGSTRPGDGSKLLYNALLGTSAGVPQTLDFFNGADAAARDAIIIEALRETVDRLTREFGPDPSTWLTPVTTQFFSDRNFFGVPAAGEGETFELPIFMNRGTQNHQVTFGSEGTSMCSVAPPGQSGFVAADGTRAPHYMDQLALYRDFECKQDWLTEAELDENLESTTVLTVER